MTQTIATEAQRETRADLMRQAERRMRRAVVCGLVRAGYAVTIDNGEAIEVRRSTNAAELMDNLSQTDADRLDCYREGEREVAGWVLLVYGNDPSELVADCTMNMESALAAATALAHRLDLQGM